MSYLTLSVLVAGAAAWWPDQPADDRSGRQWQPPAPAEPGISAGDAGVEPTSTVDRLRFDPASAGGLTTVVPRGWTVEPLTEAMNQATDPSGTRLVRFGSATAPAAGLLQRRLDEQLHNPAIRNGLRPLRLTETVFRGVNAVDWEFTFVRSGVRRHVVARYWNVGNTEYAIYVSGPAEHRTDLSLIFDAMTAAASPLR